MENEDNILISWVEEYVFCPRRFYLKVLECQQGTNIYLTEGTIAHEKVDSKRIEKRKGNIKVFGLEIYSHAHNLFGRCDEVEFIEDQEGFYIPFLDGKYTIIPSEFKHGRKRNEHEYNLQLTAQVICLEEMYGCKIDEGYIYYTNSKERFLVEIDDNLRNEVKNVISSIAEELISKKLILPKYMKRCSKCSVYDICEPRNTMVKMYMNDIRKRYYEKN